MKLHVNATEPLYISSINYIYMYVTVLSIIRYIYIVIYSYIHVFLLKCTAMINITSMYDK